LGVTALQQITAITTTFLQRGRAMRYKSSLAFVCNFRQLRAFRCYHSRKLPISSYLCPKIQNMPRILAIDYGQKRTGIAVTDELQIIASGLTTIASETTITFLKDYFEKENVAKVLIGEPKQMNGLPSQSTEVIEQFVAAFSKTFPQMPMVRVDERFTSKMAFQTMIDSGLNKKQRQNKALIDEIAATILLQDYLSRK
jgi:putative Holliday junction resolvase